MEVFHQEMASSNQSVDFPWSLIGKSRAALCEVHLDFNLHNPSPTALEVTFVEDPETTLRIVMEDEEVVMMSQDGEEV